MRLTALAFAGVLGVTLAVEAPLMSPAPWAPDSNPATAIETLAPRLSTQSRSRSCEKRGRSCQFRTCCEGLYCRQNGQGDRFCR